MWVELDKNIMSHLILLIVAIRLLTSSSHRREPNGRHGKQPCAHRNEGLRNSPEGGQGIQQPHPLPKIFPGFHKEAIIRLLFIACSNPAPEMQNLENWIAQALLLKEACCL